MGETCLHLVIFVVCGFVHFKYTACQLQIGISPAEVVLTTSMPTNTVFTCSISSGISINTIYNMRIFRMRDSLDSSFVPLCEATGTATGFVDTAPSDIEERGTVSGGLYTNSYTASTLVLTLSTEDVRCNDKGVYQCKLVYQDSSSNIATLVANGSLSLYALPMAVSMTAEKNGQNVTGKIENPAYFRVNEVVDFTCTAYIGSDNTTRIQWKRTSEFGTTDTFLTYNPQNDTYSDGIPSSSTTECQYSRTATMRYKVTTADARRDNNLAFQCFVSVVAPNSQTYTTENPPTFYINPDITTTMEPITRTDITTTTEPITRTDITTTTGPITRTGSNNIKSTEPTKTPDELCKTWCFILLVCLSVSGWSLVVAVVIFACYFRRDPASTKGILPLQEASSNITHQYQNASVAAEPNSNYEELHHIPQNAEHKYGQVHQQN